MNEPVVGLIEIVAKTSVVYVFLFVGLRMTGKREAGQPTPFDLVLLLLLANAVQNAMTGGDNSLVGGLASAVTLLVLNTVFTEIAFRSKGARLLLEGIPTQLVHEGRVLQTNLDHERITVDELLQALRENGIEAVTDVKHAFLEVDGSISVLRRDEIPTEPRPHHKLKFRNHRDK